MWGTKVTSVGHTIAFGPFTLDLLTDSLRRDGSELSLRPQARRVLRALAIQSGMYLDHGQMMKQAWDGILVSKHTVTVTVGEVKRAMREYASWITCHPRLGYCLEIPNTEEMLRLGWHHMHRGTREGLEKAAHCFEDAALAGSEGRALEGTSRAYLMLGTMGMRSPESTYPKFLAAHERVVALRGYSPELRVDRGLGLYVFERRFAEAETQILMALKEQPKLGAAYTHLAMLYTSWRRPEKALSMLQAAREADALGSGLALAEILVRFCARDFVAAEECGRKVLELHPHFPSAIVFYAAALEALGRYDDALEQYHLVCMLAPDIAWHRTMEATCFAKAGKTKRAHAVLHHLEQLRKTDYVDGYHMALLMHALGRTDDAFVELERGYREGCTTMSLIDVDPKIDALRADPRFTILRNKLFPDYAAAAC
jgi:DNA-binding winged helix-turn-helix (wHTH) protein/Flp pilus assembly protein TadD